MHHSLVEQVCPRLLIALAGFAALAEPGRAQLAPIATAPVDMTGPMQLRLEVFVNGQSTHLVEPFLQEPGESLSARRGDLEEIGIKVPGSGEPSEPVRLTSLTRISYAYDASHQQIDFRLDDSQRKARLYDARGERPLAPTAQADWGSVLNYSFYGTTANQLGAFPHFTGTNALLDGRLFGPVGALSQTAIVGNSVTTNDAYVRLDSTYSYSDPDRMVSGHAGDIIEGGLVWTRSIRMGGAQIQRDLGLRGDLVTQPLPIVSGSAAVPSTVDVFVDNVKTFSQQVGTGPYAITNLPVVSGGGTARIVTTDATGRQTETTLPFFTTPALLARGLTDFSIEAGAARRNYGFLSDDYDRHPLGAITIRRGLFDWLTVESHAEAGAGLMNGGIGAVVGLGRFGVVSVADAASRLPGTTGNQIYADYYFAYHGLNIDLSTQRTIGAYRDLASVTANTALPISTTPLYAFNSVFFDTRPPRALNRATIGFPLPFDKASVSASYINLTQESGLRSRIVTASVSRQLPFGASFFATCFYDLTHISGAGLFAGVTFSLGPAVTATVSGTTGSDTRYVQADIIKPLAPVDNSVGWRVRGAEGDTSFQGAEGAFRSTYGVADVQVLHQSKQLSTQGTLDGSIGYLTTGGFFAGNRVLDSFAVLDTGIPDVPVYEDNRLVGSTNRFGKFVVSDLHAYQRNSIGIDPLSLPVNSEAVTTRSVISTRSHAGVGLDFGIDRKVDAAQVTFVDATNQPLPAGTRGHLAMSKEGFVIGYAGEAYVKHLSQSNRALIDLGDHDCRAVFEFKTEGGKRAKIGPVTCL